MTEQRTDPRDGGPGFKIRVMIYKKETGTHRGRFYVFAPSAPVGGSPAATLGVQNPFRYRGYVYDRETGLYCLQTRYYDPEP